MTVTIELPPEIEAGLLAQAQAEGLPLSEYVQNLVRGHLVRRPGMGPVSRKVDEMAPDEWLRQFRAWTDSHADRNLPVLSDEAMGRESIYGDRGL
jgi:hypothetical protein